MIKLNNSTAGNLALPGGQVVPASGSLDIEEAALTPQRQHPVVKAWFDSKALQEGAPAPADPAGEEAKVNAAIEAEARAKEAQAKADADTDAARASAAAKTRARV